WSMQYAFAQIQIAFEGLFTNLSIPVLGPVFRGPVLWWWRLNPIGAMPTDELGGKLAQSVETPGAVRDRLTTNIYIPSHPDEALGRLEQAFQLSIQAEGILKTIKTAIREGKLTPAKPEQLIDAALAAEVITATEATLIREAEAARNEAIQVDAFSLEEYQQGAQITSWPTKDLMQHA
ncbi:MAG TPA: acyl-CoA dehydrogenase domain-containing protein, partial [Candidatus Obscuribacterales bacterium]